jgi:hypothetical protein
MPTFDTDMTLKELMVELKAMSNEEQQALLISLRARKLLSDGIPDRTLMPKGMNAPSMEEIDRIKHLSRQADA